MTERSTLSPALARFADEVAEALDKAKGPDFFTRCGPQELDELRVLRRWNSHTAALLHVWGGGYFLRWKGLGTIIDPGVSFLRLFELYTNYGLQDIDMILATHDHVDHCHDLGILISLTRAFNKWGKKQKKPLDEHFLDVVVSHGVADEFASVLTNSENGRNLRWRKALPPASVVQASTQPGRARLGGPASVSRKYGYKLAALPAFHTELLGENTGMGLGITLNGCKKKIVISSDTALARDPGSLDAGELVRAYEGADLLILHVGSMDEPRMARLPQHLGSTGVIKILEGLTKRPELVVLTEWGYEFGRNKLRGRTRFTELVAQELQGRGCRYFAAVEGAAAPKDDATPILPADLSLRISLPGFKVHSEREGEPVAARDIRAVERGARIRYV